VAFEISFPSTDTLVATVSAGPEGAFWNAAQLLCQLSQWPDNALSVQQFLARHQITVLLHTPSSLDLSQSDFFIPTAKTTSKRSLQQ
jgi:hypothetical protein